MCLLEQNLLLGEPHEAGTGCVCEREGGRERDVVDATSPACFEEPKTAPQGEGRVEKVKRTPIHTGEEPSVMRTCRQSTPWGDATEKEGEEEEEEEERTLGLAKQLRGMDGVRGRFLSAAGVHSC